MKIKFHVAYNAGNTFTSTANIKIPNKGSYHGVRYFNLLKPTGRVKRQQD
jgi:hypothetical protein